MYWNGTVCSFFWSLVCSIFLLHWYSSGNFIFWVNYRRTTSRTAQESFAPVARIGDRTVLWRLESGTNMTIEKIIWLRTWRKRTRLKCSTRWLTPKYRWRSWEPIGKRVVHASKIDHNQEMDHAKVTSHHENSNYQILSSLSDRDATAKEFPFMVSLYAIVSNYISFGKTKNITVWSVFRAKRNLLRIIWWSVILVRRLSIRLYAQELLLEIDGF